MRLWITAVIRVVRRRLKHPDRWAVVWDSLLDDSYSFIVVEERYLRLAEEANRLDAAQRLEGFDQRLDRLGFHWSHVDIAALRNMIAVIRSEPDDDIALLTIVAHSPLGYRNLEDDQ